MAPKTYHLLLPLFVAFAFLGLSAKAEYQLAPTVYLSGCPFVHEDQYDFTPLLNTIKSQLESKIESKKNCNQKINSVYGSISTISNYYASIDQSSKQRIANDVLKNYLSDLNLQRVELELSNQTSSTQYFTLLSSISALEAQLTGNQIDFLYNKENQRANSELEFRKSLLNHVNNLVVNLASISSQDPKCLDQIGGWQQLLPAVLTSASLASGLGAFAGQQVIGFATQLSANIIVLFQDVAAKKALNQIISNQNAQILACTYFAVKNSACEFKRGYELSQDIPKIKELILRRYSDGPVGEYEKYFRTFGKRGLYGQIFKSIASMGSSLTLDINLIIKYILAKVADPEAIQPPPLQGTDAEKKAWINDARLRGISVPELVNGAPVSIDDQLKYAQSDISQKISDIQATDAQLQNTRSFVDLRNHLEATYPAIRKDVQELNDFLNSYVTGSAGRGIPIPASKRGPILAIVNILNKLQDFLAVPVTDSSSYEQYDNEVTRRGTELFTTMAKGAIGQINKQSLLGLGPKVQDRLLRAFQSIQNYFVERDISTGVRAGQNFTDYQKDRALLSDVIDNYGKYQAAGTTFRSESFDTALKSFEKGFKSEILNVMDRVLSDKASLVPGLKGKTADHLCSLYASSLEEMDGWFFANDKAKRLLERCKKEHPTIDLFGYLETKSFSIDYKDKCSYPNYVRSLRMQQLLSDHMLENGS